MNVEYRYMQSDAFNLFASIGSVNATRSNYRFTQFGHGMESSFGSCDFKVRDRKVEPDDAAKGIVARTQLYFDSAYPKFTLSGQQRKLMNVWNKDFSVTYEECRKGYLITEFQGNTNGILKALCKKNKMWQKITDNEH